MCVCARAEQQKKQQREKEETTTSAHGHDEAHGNRIIQKIFHWVLWEA